MQFTFSFTLNKQNNKAIGGSLLQPYKLDGILSHLGLDQDSQVTVKRPNNNTHKMTKKKCVCRTKCALFIPERKLRHYSISRQTQ